jgi:hypothetical protein
MYLEDQGDIVLSSLYLFYCQVTLHQCFSTFVKPRRRKFFFFYKTRAPPGPHKFTGKYLPNFFLSSYIKLT